MKFLVTGATGYLGSYLVKALIKEHHNVIILKRSFSDVSHISDVLNQMMVYDIDRCELEVPFKDNNDIDGVIHTATCYGRKNEDLTTLFNSNTFFPLKILELSSKYNIDFFINSDTSLSKELNEYSLSKSQFLEWGKWYAKLKKIVFINIKLEHFYGAGDDVSKFTTYIIKNCLQNTSELQLTLGDQKRDFVYIEDVLSAYLLLLNKKYLLTNFFYEFELGSGKTVSLRHFVELVHKLTKSKTILNFGAIPYREHEIMFSKANIKALLALGWQPKFQLKNGLIDVIKKEKQNEGINNRGMRISR